MKKIAIIGGGAAGMMCAATLVEGGFDGEIHLFERNPSLGAKVIISGGGRCNVTTGISDAQELRRRYLRGAAFLDFALDTFSPQDIYSWIEHHGVPLKTEKDLRVFPKSNDGRDIVKMFDELLSRKVIFHFSESVGDITKDEKFHVTTAKDQYIFSDIVLTTGGNAYRHTGSQGDGYTFAQNLGHTITQRGPSLSSFEAINIPLEKLQGIALPDAVVRVDHFTYQGGVLFTHFGVTGPAIFAASSFLALATIDDAHPVTLSIAPCGKEDVSYWDQKLQSDLQQYGKKQIKSILAEHMPEKIVAVLLAQANVDITTKAAELSKKSRQNIAQLIANGFTVTITKRRKGDEFVTAGGVNTIEVNPRTGESFVCPHLYFAGEILDVDGLTGGFNLTSSWSLGRLVGNALLSKL